MLDVTLRSISYRWTLENLLRSIVRLSLWQSPAASYARLLSYVVVVNSLHPGTIVLPPLHLKHIGTLKLVSWLLVGVALGMFVGVRNFDRPTMV